MEITRRVKRSRRVRAAGRSGPQSRMFAGRWRARGAGRAREQISPLSETTSWNSRYSRAPKIGARIARRNGRASERRGGGWGRRERVFGEREGRRTKRNRSNKEEEEKGDGEENEIKCRDEAFRISSSDPARRWKKRRTRGEKERERETGPKRIPLNPGISESFEQC